MDASRALNDELLLLVPRAGRRGTSTALSWSRRHVGDLLVSDDFPVSLVVDERLLSKRSWTPVFSSLGGFFREPPNGKLEALRVTFEVVCILGALPNIAFSPTPAGSFPTEPVGDLFPAVPVEGRAFPPRPHAVFF